MSSAVLGQLHAKSENGFIVLGFSGVGGGVWGGVGRICVLYTCSYCMRVRVSDRCLQQSVVFQTSVSINGFLF